MAIERRILRAHEHVLAREASADALGDLGDEKNLRQIAIWKMEGLTNDEVAQRLDCSRRTVARKLETIRIIWSRDLAP